MIAASSVIGSELGGRLIAEMVINRRAALMMIISCVVG
jgi:hypothetical protein